MSILKRLKNGIPVIMVPQDGVASMTFMVFVKVGSRYEEQEINGASHFIEHLMFKGTKRRRTSLAITKELDRYGAEYNAFTSKDLTAYYVKMDATHTALAVDLLHDMLFSSRFDKQEIERERGVIVEEINMYEDNPASHMSDLLEQALFPNSSLGWNIAGPRETIRTISPEALKNYHKRYYIPSRLTLTLAGKIDKQAWDLLENTFGSLVEPKVPADGSFAPFEKPETEVHALAFQQKKIEQVQLGLAFYGLPHGHAQGPAMRLLGTILGGSMSSRLFMEVREKRGLCYSVSAGHYGFEDTGMFTVAAGLDRTRLPEALSAIWQELEKTKKTLVTLDELQRAKDHIRGKWTLSLEDSANQADWYGRQLIFQGKVTSPEERIKLVDAVTATDIRQLAKQIFDSRCMGVSVVGPYKSKKEVEKIVNGVLRK
jgi:predicted Zn-dependent peptidase